MITEKLNSTYQNGKRIENQRVIYEKSDDLYVLADLNRRYENVRSEIAAAPAGADTNYLQAEKRRLETEITAQQAIVDGYSVNDDE